MGMGVPKFGGSPKFCDTGFYHMPSLWRETGYEAK